MPAERLTWEQRAQAAYEELECVGIWPVPRLAMDRALKAAGLRDLIVEREERAARLREVERRQARLLKSCEDAEADLNAVELERDLAEGNVVSLSRQWDEEHARVHELTAELEQAREALREIDATRNSRTLCRRHGGEAFDEADPDSCVCSISLDAETKMRAIARAALVARVQDTEGGSDG